MNAWTLPTPSAIPSGRRTPRCLRSSPTPTTSAPRAGNIRDGRVQVVRWGQSRSLPRTGWTWLETIQGDGWRNSPAGPVDIPANYALERRGVWYLVERGVRGLLVPDERGAAVACMICEPSSHYYRITTGSERMPVMIERQI